MNESAQRAANSPVSLTSLSGLTGELRAFARNHLPEAMVPSRFVVLDEFPKLPNGKIDRSRLRKVDTLEQNEDKFVPPATPEEIRIAEIWRDILGVSRIGVNDNFFELGGDSLTVVQMAARIRKEYGVALSLRQLFKNPTLSALVQMAGAKIHVPVTGGLRNLNEEELIAEAHLPEDVVPEKTARAPAVAPYRYILLTGGTGYTGAFLLRELLDRSDAEICVLARAKDAADAVKRVQENLCHYGLWKDTDLSRLKGVAGEIGRPYFGITRSAYEELAEHVEMIIHNGALSSYAMPYRQLKPVNVLGTLEVLRLACLRRIKPVHYISSLSVFSGQRGNPYYREVVLTEPNGLVGGYRQSKWVAERLVALARQRGIPTNIYRPGQITGAQDTGACSTDTYLNAGIKGCIQLGAELPLDVMLEITPVDFCAKAVAHIALSGSMHGQQFHLIGTKPVSWGDLVNMIRNYGYRLRQVPYPVWYRELATSLESGEGNALSEFFPLFGEEAPSADAGDEGSKPNFDASNLAAALKGSGITARLMDQSLVNDYLDYFVSIGYLAPPGLKQE